MGKRYIKEEDGKKIVYEEYGGAFGSDKRLGELEETTIFDITSHDYIYKPDNWHESTEYVDRDRNIGNFLSFLPPGEIPEDHIFHGDNGQDRRLEYNYNRGRYDESELAASPNNREDGCGEQSYPSSFTHDGALPTSSADAVGVPFIWRLMCIPAFYGGLWVLQNQPEYAWVGAGICIVSFVYALQAAISILIFCGLLYAAIQLFAHFFGSVTTTLPTLEPGSSRFHARTLPYPRTYYVDTKQLNVREGPGKEYNEMGKLLQGDTVVATESATSSNDKPWVRVRSGNLEGWVNRTLLSESQRSTNVQGEVSETLYVNTKQLNVRSGSGPSHPEIGKLPLGEVVTVTDSATSDNGKPWVKITANGLTGWVNKTLLSAEQPAESQESCSGCSIPMQFRGLWLTPEECGYHRRNDIVALESTVEIKEKEVVGYENGCDLVSVSASTATLFTGNFSCSGEGEVWTSTRTFRLSAGRLIEGEPPGLIRCD